MEPEPKVGEEAEADEWWGEGEGGESEAEEDDPPMEIKACWPSTDFNHAWQENEFEQPCPEVMPTPPASKSPLKPAGLISPETCLDSVRRPFKQRLD